jgi:hypothetical protein
MLSVVVQETAICCYHTERRRNNLIIFAAFILCGMCCSFDEESKVLDQVKLTCWQELYHKLRLFLG